MRAASSFAARAVKQQRGIPAARGCNSTPSACSNVSASGAVGRPVNLRFRSTVTQRTVDIRGILVRGGARDAAGHRIGHAGARARVGCARDQGYLHIQRAAFHDFFGGGGPGGGGGGDTEFYERLGVSKDASAKEIKTAFRKLAMKNHPDQGGDAEKFTKIQEAYEVLSDEDKRRQYDQFGKAGVDGSFGQGGPGGGFGGGQYEGFDVNDVFSQFFGGGGGGRRRGPVRTEDMTYNLTLDLESLYNGMTKKIAVNRNALCGTCDGLGAASASDITTCSVCGGRGVVITTRQLGPMLQQVQQECHACGGEGKTIAAGKQCSTCGGNKVVRERKTFDVKIKPGTLPNSRLVLRGESNQMPGATPGDVCLIINEKPHPTFKRQGSDLIYEHKLPLVDALTGFAVPVKFLDGSTLLLQNSEGDAPIAPDTINKVRGKGMKASGGRPDGDLYVVWKIDMPDAPFDEDTKAQLRKLLGGGDAADPNADEFKDAEKVTLEDTTASDRRRGQRAANNASEDEEGGGSNCRQM